MTSPVMVVDDSLMVRQQVKQALTEAGFEVVEAVDGIDALEKAMTTPVSLVVCDVNMPRMNGLEFLEQLRRREVGGARTPVVMLTTEGQHELIQRARALGAKGWIIKPFKADLLVATAKKLACGT
jgi:two-component system chemotaxis response regulator CheY